MENNDIIKSQLKAVDEMFNINYITAENALFERTPGGFLAMRYKDEYYPRIQPYRAFPFTDSDRFISIRTNNGNENKEIGMIEELKSLPEEYRRMIEEQLELRYFMPEIIRIHSIREEYGYSYWGRPDRQGRMPLYHQYERRHGGFYFRSKNDYQGCGR